MLEPVPVAVTPMRHNDPDVINAALPQRPAPQHTQDEGTEPMQHCHQCDTLQAQLAELRALVRAMAAGLIEAAEPQDSSGLFVNDR